MEAAGALLSRIFSGPLSGFIGTMGLLLVLLSLRLAWRSYRLSRGEIATGTVVRWRRIRNRDGKDSFAPVVSFVPRGSVEPVEVQPQHDFRKTPGEEGEFIQLRYDPENPARAESASMGRQAFAVLCIFLFGLGTLFAAWKVGGEV